MLAGIDAHRALHLRKMNYPLWIVSDYQSCHDYTVLNNICQVFAQ